MGELAARLPELESHRDLHVIVHCHHGGRSLRVTHFLRQNGFSQVQNMTAESMLVATDRSQVLDIKRSILKPRS